MPLPPDMSRYLAAWFTTWSMVSSVKSTKRTSTTGRMPVIAAPTPAPTMLGSAMGVSMTRFDPNSSSRPRVIW